MTVTLVGSPATTCTWRVAVVLAQLGVPYEFSPVDLRTGIHKTPAYLAKHPFGQVPYIEDDGLLVYESRAIARYLAAKYGPTPLLPPPGDLPRLALFEQAASVEAADFDPSAFGIISERVFKPMFGVPADEARAAQHITTLSQKLEGYERILAKQRYVGGDRLSIVDLFHLPVGSVLAKAGHPLLDDKEKHPNVARWWTEIENLPAWQTVKEKYQS